MDSIIRLRTRRHLLKLTAAVAATLPLIALPLNSAQAEGDVKGDNGPPLNRGADCKNDGTKCCFLKGTRIATPTGKIPVEELQINDQVCALDGIRRIKWIGYDRIPTQNRILEGITPIRVARFAIDDTTPIRDLYLSPGHCLFADGGLIPVEYLINGTSVSYQTQSRGEWIEYYHVEFDRHEIVLPKARRLKVIAG